VETVDTEHQGSFSFRRTVDSCRALPIHLELEGMEGLEVRGGEAAT